MDFRRIYLILIVELYFNKVSANDWHKFTRVNVLNHNVCPVDLVITEIQNAVKTDCLYLCSKHSNCTGAFVQQVNNQCVLCSAKYLTHDTGSKDVGYEFYKRKGNTIEGGSIRNIFWLVKQLLTWNSSQETCENNGGHLASIKTSEDNTYILQTVLAGSITSFWTGGTGLGGMASTFVWNDGSSIEDGFTNWKPGQPFHQGHGTPTCLSTVYSSDFKWDDASCTANRHALCSLN